MFNDYWDHLEPEIAKTTHDSRRRRTTVIVGSVLTEASALSLAPEVTIVSCLSVEMQLEVSGWNVKIT